MKESFLNQLEAEVRKRQSQIVFGNHDNLRFPRSPAIQLRELGVLLLKKTGLDAREEDLEARLVPYQNKQKDWEWLYQTLADEESRSLLLNLLCYRILGPRRVSLASVSRQWPQAVRRMETSRISGMRQSVGAGPLASVEQFRWPADSGQITLFCHPLNLINTFCLEQYATGVEGGRIQVQPGHVVVDGGGCWGDTALYFAEKTGKTGKVHVFEFSPTNLGLLKKNLSFNPELSDIIRIHPFALSDQSDQQLFFEESGAGTHLKQEEGNCRATTKTIDYWRKEECIGKVDFIKLDIEGFEIPALRGASRTIDQYRPTLAVAAYHHPEDLFGIPKEILKIKKDYKIHLRHFTIHSEETVIYAA